MKEMNDSVFVKGSVSENILKANGGVTRNTTCGSNCAEERRGCNHVTAERKICRKRENES